MLRIITLIAFAITASLAGPITIHLPSNVANQTHAVPFRDIGGRIINGTPASLGQFPWQVALYFSVAGRTSFCGGSVISPNWILTAAHCVDSRVTAITAYLGVIALNDENGRVIQAIKTAYVHENYNPSIIANDISLLETVEPIVFSDVINSIRLSTTPLDANVAVTVSGWGRTSDANPSISQTLNYVGLTTISNDECLESYNIVQAGIVCAIGSNLASTCNGDSGGPLTTGSGADIRHVGIVSFGSSRGCAQGYPTAYTRTEIYHSWITAVSGVN